MGYEESLIAAGANIKEFAYFGSYQGDWLALVEYDGKTGWVSGSYGSCSGCDAFEAEFGYVDPIDNEILSAFGKSYLDMLYSQEEIEKQVSKDLYWDSEAKEMLDFVKKNDYR